MVNIQGMVNIQWVVNIQGMVHMQWVVNIQGVVNIIMKVANFLSLYCTEEKLDLNIRILPQKTLAYHQLQAKLE